jgi:hypothetical protein
VSAAQPRIKGAGIRPFLVWYAARYGAGRLLAAAAAIPPAQRAGLDLDDPCLGVLASSWYPAASIHALLDELLAGVPADQHAELAREGARAIIDSTLKGVYRLLFQTMMTPERYARNAQALFARFYDTGTMEKTPLAPAGHLSRVRDWSSHHPMLCEFIGHTAEYVYAALGCRDVKVRRSACVALGGEECRFEITWKP